MLQSCLPLDSVHSPISHQVRLAINIVPKKLWVRLSYWLYSCSPVQTFARSSVYVFWLEQFTSRVSAVESTLSAFGVGKCHCVVLWRKTRGSVSSISKNCDHFRLDGWMLTFTNLWWQKFDSFSVWTGFALTIEVACLLEKWKRSRNWGESIKC